MGNVRGMRGMEENGEDFRHDNDSDEEGMRA